MVLSVVLATITQSNVCIFCSCGWYLSNVSQRCTQGVKYYRRPKRSSNKIQILEMEFEFGKKRI